MDNVLRIGNDSWSRPEGADTFAWKAFCTIKIEQMRESEGMNIHAFALGYLFSAINNYAADRPGVVASISEGIELALAC